MLTLTENASTIITTLTTQPGAPASAGLRISSDPEQQAGLAIAAVADALPGDQVVEQDGATLYLDESASQELDDKILDAAVDQAGGVQFSVGLQA